MKELKNIISQTGMEEKAFAENIKYMVDVDRRTGSEVMEMVNEQTGLSLTKDELYSFLLEHIKNPAGEAFSINMLKLWNK